MGVMEIERRPHWSDDLIGAVGNAIADIPAYDWQAGTVRDARVLLDDYIGHIHTLIAIVEDWQESNGWLLVGMIHEQRDRAEKDEAAIQRVRELCREARVGLARGCTCYGDECSGICGYGKPLAWDLDPDAVLRALDGGDDDE